MRDHERGSKGTMCDDASLHVEKIANRHLRFFPAFLSDCVRASNASYVGDSRRFGIDGLIGNLVWLPQG